ncbi:transferase [Spirochaetia bacterium]|nr:transferase [Spirochaetia bacterium]
MERKKLVIVGANGLAREILFLLSDVNAKTNCYDILGFIDKAPELQNKIINNFPVLGDDSWLLNYHDEIHVVIAIGNSQVRKRIFEKFAFKENIIFPTIIANDVKYSDSVTIGKGCIIGFSSLLTVNIVLGDFVFLNAYCVIGHDVTLGDFVTLYGNVNVSGNVSIGTGAEIGVGTRIIQNKSIGENSKVGIGSVVVRNVPSNCTIFGVPAKRIL